ncbi:MAG: gamma-glutamyl-gamma-aminobutyrate hydrolase family protein [Patescibacteria group bacterium]
MTSPRVLLVQVRTDDMKLHELECFLRHTGLTNGQVRSLDVFHDTMELSVLDDVDALVIGGAGEFCVSGNTPDALDGMMALARAARARAMPLLGMCYGAHVLTVAFGGRVICDSSRMEFGTYRVVQTPAAGACPVFGQMPSSYDAQFGHKDHIDTLPLGAVNLAASELSPFQAWTFPGEPVYALQIHAELDEEGVSHRMRYYAKMYHLDDGALVRQLATVRPSPSVPMLLKRFVQHVIVDGRVYPRNTQE